MPGELFMLRGPFDHAGFALGLVAGLITVLVLFVGSRIVGPPIPGWALALTGATVWVFVVAFEVEGQFVVGLSLLAIAGVGVDGMSLVGEGRGRIVSLGWSWGLMLAAGGGFVWLSDFPDLTWLAIAAVVVTLAAGSALRTYRSGPMASLLGPMFALTVFGVWATVPETDMIRVALGAAAGMALATLPPIRARPTSAGSFPLAGLVVWLAALGGVARPGSIIAAWACFGLLLLLPIPPMSKLPINRHVLLGFHLFVVLTASRVMGSWESVTATLIGVMGLFLFAASGILLMARLPILRSGARSPHVED